MGALDSGSVVGSGLTDDERLAAARLVGGILRASAPGISPLLESWASGALDVGTGDDEDSGEDGLSELRFVGQAQLPMGKTQWGSRSFLDGAGRGENQEADRDDASQTRENGTM